MKRGLNRLLLAGVVLLLYCTTSFSQGIGSSFGLCEHDEGCANQYGQEMLIQLALAAQWMLEERGEEVFKEFQETGSVWRNGLGPDLFVVDPDGLFVVHPNPRHVGEDALKLKDENGSLFIKKKLQEYSVGQQSGLTRLWNKIKDFQFERLYYTVIAVAPNGIIYLVGSSLKTSTGRRSNGTSGEGTQR